jgi:hypothetical protein
MRTMKYIQSTKVPMELPSIDLGETEKHSDDGKPIRQQSISERYATRM